MQFAEKEINKLDSNSQKGKNAQIMGSINNIYFLFNYNQGWNEKLSISYWCAFMISYLYVHQIWIPKRKI